jgi:hypothetical protein
VASVIALSPRAVAKGGNVGVSAPAGGSWQPRPPELLADVRELLGRANDVDVGDTVALHGQRDHEVEPM